MRKKRLLSLLTVVSLLTTPVQASTDRAVNISIPVSCTAINCTEEFFYYMEGDNDYPASPDVLRLKDGDSGDFKIAIDYPGTYHYQISQERGSDKNSVYDDTVYQADIFVTEDSSGILSAEAILYAEDSNSKSSQCSFVNVNKKPAAQEDTDQPEQKPPVSNEQELEKNDASSIVTGPKTGLTNHAGIYAGTGFLILALVAAFVRFLKKRREER